MRGGHLRNSAAVLCVIASAALLLEARTSRAGERPAKEAAIFRDASLPPVAFAAGEIRKELEALGFAVKEKAWEGIGADRSPVRILLPVANPKTARGPAKEFAEQQGKSLGKQGYLLGKFRSRPRRERVQHYLAMSIDPIGTMYGGLHLAESIRIHKGLDGIARTTKTPYIERRGIKFNIPLDVRTPSYDDTGDAAQKNYEHMWDFSFWREFLDDMARHRYNTLTLWNPHPFPSIVKCPNYPDVALDNVCTSTVKPTYQTPMSHNNKFHESPALDHLVVVKKLTIDEKIAFWRKVMKHAKDRGIDIYFITWNVLTNGTFGKYGINNDQDNLTTIAYLRESVRQTILTYPDLAGIGVTAGENMKNRDDEFSKEKWLWKTYGLGVMDAKKKQPDRHVRFLHRVWQTGVAGITEDFGRRYPDTFEVGFKYARAHMYSSPDPPFDDKLCEELKASGVKCWWNLRNDDIFNFRWGDPDYAREFILHLPPKELTAGYHMGSDGYVWGVEHTSTEPESPRQLEIKKHWYKFMLWGRLGYDPKLDSEFFTKVLAARFPETAAPYLYATWAEASKIIPLVNQFHWNNWDFMWSVEACIDRGKGFHTVDDFIEGKPMERSGMISIPEFVDRRLAGQPVNETTPVKVAEQLRRHATDVLSVLGQIRRKTPRPGKELRLTLSDVEAMAHLGNYYSAKILGAVEL
ncbi:MAG: carbohydrate-binding family 6 protein, partial [Planctomycetota bacterium]